MDDKYEYSNCCGVYVEHYKHSCFMYATYNPKKTYALPLVMSKENADKWLNLINEVITFKWEFEGDRVTIYPPKTDFTFLIFFGNLTKGVSEFAFFCEKHLEDKSNNPFFVKNWKAFKSISHLDLMEVSYSSNHGWFTYNDHKATEYPRKNKTLQKVSDNFTKWNKTPVWTNIL